MNRKKFLEFHPVTAGSAVFSKDLRLILPACAVALSSAVPAFAQEHVVQDSAVRSSVEDIVVTARKREERLQDVPDSVSVLGAATIEDARVASVADVTRLVPNLSIVQTQQPGVDFLVIRGIGQVRNQDPPVAVVIDGVQMTNSYALTQELFDIERIEVLKGPQGALYGRNAIGGAINIETKRPIDRMEGKLIAGAANGDEYQLKGMLSGPLGSDRVLARVGAAYTDYGGLLNNVTLNRKVDFREDLSLQGRLLLLPTDNFSIDLRASYQDTDSGAAYNNPVDGPQDFVSPIQADRLGRASRRLEEYAGRIRYENGDFAISSVTAFGKLDTSISQDLDWYSAPIQTADQSIRSRSFSQEIRFDYNPDSWLNLTLGGYYLDKDMSTVTNVQGNGANRTLFLQNRADGIYPLTTGLAMDAVLSPLAHVAADDFNKGFAGFANAFVNLSETLKLTLGLRYDQDRKRQEDLVSGRITKATFSKWQPKISLAYNVNSDAMVYATWAQGFRSGGFNASPILGRVYRPEIATSAEAGVKTTWLDGRLTLNGAAFYTSYENRQEFVLITAAAAQVLINIPKSRIYGLEADLSYRPVRDLSLQASIGVMDTKIQDFDPISFGLSAAQDYQGNQLPFVYNWSYSIAAQYEHRLSNDLKLVPRIEYNARGGMSWSIEGMYDQEDIHLVNAQISLERGNFKTSLWAENLLNQIYFNNFSAPTLGGGLSNIAYYAMPRRYGLRASILF